VQGKKRGYFLNISFFYAMLRITVIYNTTRMLLLSTASLTGYGLHRIFQFAKSAEYTGLDIALGTLNFDLWDEDYIYDLSKEFNIPVLSLTAPGKGMSQKKLEKIMMIAKKLSVQVVTFSPPHITDKESKWFGAPLAQMKQLTHLSICVQNVEPKFLFFLIPEYRNATLTQIKSVTGDTALDLLGVDSSSSMDILKAQKILGSSVKNIYFSDKYGMRRGILPGGAGGGISYLPLESFLMKLKASGYGGYVTLKVNPKEIGVGNAERVLQNLEYMKKYYEKHYKNFNT